MINILITILCIISIIIISKQDKKNYIKNNNYIKKEYHYAWIDYYKDGRSRIYIIIMIMSIIPCVNYIIITIIIIMLLCILTYKIIIKLSKFLN